MKDTILQKDFDFFSKNFPFKNEMKEGKFLITGASGLIGSLFIKYLSFLNKKFGLNLKIYGMIRKPSPMQDDPDLKDVNWIIQDLNEPLKFDIDVDFIIHTACPTQSKFMISNPVELITSTIMGTKNLLEYAKTHNCKSFIYLSSVEVYGVNENDLEIDENFYGAINSLEIRSCYPLSKKLLECLCRSYFQEYNVPAKIVRLSQTIGVGINKNDNRVHIQFAKSILNKQNLVLNTEGKTAKSYVYTMDAVNAILYVILKGQAGEVYNVTNQKTYKTIKEVAEFLVENFDKNLQVVINKKDNMGFAKDSKLNISSKKLEALGWKPFYDLKKMFENLIEYLQEENLC